jgi:hypothetical protein
MENKKWKNWMSRLLHKRWHLIEAFKFHNAYYLKTAIYYENNVSIFHSNTGTISVAVSDHYSTCQCQRPATMRCAASIYRLCASAKANTASPAINTVRLTGLYKTIGKAMWVPGTGSAGSGSWLSPQEAKSYANNTRRVCYQTTAMRCQSVHVCH